MSETQIKPNLLGRFFDTIRCIKCNPEAISLISSNGSRRDIAYSLLVDIPTISSGILGLTLKLNVNGKTLQFKYLEKQSANIGYTEIKGRVVAILGGTIRDLGLLFKGKALGQYLRDSDIEILERAITPLVERYRKSKEAWDLEFEGIERETLKLFLGAVPLDSAKAHIRKNYEDKTLNTRKALYDSVEAYPLTGQQRLAVVRNNDRNLVLAAAGTGKTSVMVAKAIDLIVSGAAKHNDILILAYNRAAAAELSERVGEKASLQGISPEALPKVSTFHALGRQILKESGASTLLSDLSEDRIKLKMWVTSWIERYIQSGADALRDFIQLSYQPVNPFDFKTKADYDAYIRDNEYRTLAGERVKGYQELVIANWLFMNGVEYEYEAPYVSKRRIEIGYDYRPDFHFPGTNIYLEHFGIDRSGNTREDIDKHKYGNDMQVKRELHQECETQLLETFHYDWMEGRLEERLEDLVTKAKLPITPKSQEEIFGVLKEMGFIDRESERYLKCLQAIRTERLDRDGILERLKKNHVVHAQLYTELLVNLHADYCAELVKQGRIDFDDMILRSIEAIDVGKFKPRWKYILVDEFQDISMARKELLESLISNGPRPMLTVVGDDWQSIYRFAGGKLELTTRFEELMGVHSLTKLEKTFRYNNSIADTAGMFVMQNPEQYEKHVETHEKVNKSQVFLLDSKVGDENSLDERIVQVIRAIRKRDTSGSIAVLARYNYLLDNARERVKQEKGLAGIKYWTFHGSKGLEADYCVLVGFFQGKSGFPNQNKEEIVVESLLPSLDAFPHSEERRLLYVALTRAKRKSYLIADPMATSEFIVELLAPKYKMHIASEAFKGRSREMFKCPHCTTGHFRLRSGIYGPFYSCSTGSVCPSKPRICDKCGAPSLDVQKASICNNRNCRNEIKICDRCGRPMRLRDGKFGKFWGCSGYGIESDRCKHTRKYLPV